MVKKMCCVGLVMLLSFVCFVKAETVTISGNGPVFDTSVDVTYGYQVPTSTLWLREYWNNDYQGFGAYDCRPLIRVDLSSIPANATINSVSFNLKVIYANNQTAAYCDLWKVHPFTDAVSAWKYDGVNDWPTMSPYYNVSYFDGIDGYNYIDPYTWEYMPAGMHLATSDMAINWDVSDQWISFSDPELTSYIQTQSNQAAGSRFAYFEVSYRDESSEWVEFYSNETGDPSLFPYMTVTYSTTTPGDANHDNKVNVVDLGILATNYGVTGTATWEMGDFDGDTNVNVVDLGILATNYGAGEAAAAADAKAFGLDVPESQAKDDTDVATGITCPATSLPLIAGLLLAGLMLVKLEQ